MITLFAALSAGANTYLRCNFCIFFFNDLTERLGGCLYKCGCLVKLSILMSMMRENSFFQSLRACTPSNNSHLSGLVIGLRAYPSTSRNSCAILKIKMLNCCICYSIIKEPRFLLFKILDKSHQIWYLTYGIGLTLDSDAGLRLQEGLKWKFVSWRRILVIFRSQSEYEVV